MSTLPKYIQTEFKKEKLQFTIEGISIFFFSLFILGVGILSRHEFLIFLSSLFIAFVISLRLWLPTPKIKFKLESFCPDFFQAEGWSTHLLKLTPEFSGPALPFISISAVHSQTKQQHIKSSVKKLNQLVSDKVHEFQIMIKPEQQGSIQFKGLKITSHASFGIFKWDTYISCEEDRPIHPKCIKLRNLTTLDNIIVDSSPLLTNPKSHYQGDFLGWPKAYQPGDPLSAIDWKRLAQNPTEPIVHSPLTSEPQKFILLIDASLQLRKKGVQNKMNVICEFTRALATQLEAEGSELEVTICTDQPYHYDLKNSTNWKPLLNHLATLKVVKVSCAQQEIERLNQQNNIKLLVFSLETSKNNLQNTAITMLSYTQMLPLIYESSFHEEVSLT